MLSINCKGRLITFDIPLVMGIINTTPDSFYKGSRKENVETVIQTAERMLVEGATILDVGGQSTRPGSTRVPVDEELKRTIPAIEAIAHAFPNAFISADTFYAKVAEEAVAAGASMVNDVSAGSVDDTLLETVGRLGVPYVLMHMQGDPETMQQNPVYNNVVLEVFDYLNFKIKSLTEAGVKDIIIDPGFGFGKTAKHNLQILQQLDYFKKIGLPLLMGLSRKATIYKTLGVTADEALNGTTVLNTISLLKGADILRVHDVKEAVEAVKLVQAFKYSSKNKAAL
ncbi:MAG: dihydropteroate synthase [Bacteroidota bacterium]|nr:dihydropteroate synthase [Bacteroidota bacterium]